MLLIYSSVQGYAVELGGLTRSQPVKADSSSPRSQQLPKTPRPGAGGLLSPSHLLAGFSAALILCRHPQPLLSSWIQQCCCVQQKLVYSVLPGLCLLFLNDDHLESEVGRDAPFLAERSTLIILCTLTNSNTRS